MLLDPSDLANNLQEQFASGNLTAGDVAAALDNILASVLESGQPASPELTQVGIWWSRTV